MFETWFHSRSGCEAVSKGPFRKPVRNRPKRRWREGPLVRLLFLLRLLALLQDAFTLKGPLLGGGDPQQIAEDDIGMFPEVGRVPG